MYSKAKNYTHYNKVIMSKLANHPAPIIIGLIASLIGIFVWVSGITDYKTLVDRCTLTKAEQISQSTFNGSTYTNTYFGFNITIPSGWTVNSKEQRDSLMAVGRRMFSNDPNAQKAYDELLLTSSCILYCSRAAIGTKTEANTSLIIIAEDLKNSPGITDGKEFLSCFKDEMDKTDIKVKSNNISSIHVDGKDIYYSEIKTKYLSVIVKQIDFAFIVKRYAIGITITYTDDKDFSTLVTAVKSLHFSNLN